MTDEQVIDALGFSVASEEIQKRVLDSARETVEMRLMSLVSEMMNNEQASEFHRRTESGDNQSGWDYLSSDVINGSMHELYEATMSDYISEFTISKAP